MQPADRSPDARSIIPPHVIDRVDLAGAQVATARLGDALIFLTDREAGPAVLKVGRGRAGEDISAEAARLLWIGEQLPVPRVLASGVEGNRTYVLMTRLPGEPGQHAARKHGVSAIIARFATALSRVHAVPALNCPFTSILTTEFEAAVQNVRSGRVDVEAFEREVGEAPAAILDRLSRDLHAWPEDTFTHGDYCLPNILISDRGDGIVDWGTGGVSDPYRDFMSAELTINRNFGPDHIPAFYQAYGATDIDRNRLNFHWMLDRFSFHLKPA